MRALEAAGSPKFGPKNASKVKIQILGFDENCPLPPVGDFHLSEWERCKSWLSEHDLYDSEKCLQTKKCQSEAQEKWMVSALTKSRTTKSISSGGVLAHSVGFGTFSWTGTGR